MSARLRTFRIVNQKVLASNEKEILSTYQRRTQFLVVPRIFRTLGRWPALVKRSSRCAA